MKSNLLTKPEVLEFNTKILKSRHPVVHTTKFTEAIFHLLVKLAKAT